MSHFAVIWKPHFHHSCIIRVASRSLKLSMEVWAILWLPCVLNLIRGRHAWTSQVGNPWIFKKLPAQADLAAAMRTAGVTTDFIPESVETFIVNLGFARLLRTFFGGRQNSSTPTFVVQNYRDNRLMLEAHLFTSDWQLSMRRRV